MSFSWALSYPTRDLMFQIPLKVGGVRWWRSGQRDEKLLGSFWKGSWLPSFPVPCAGKRILCSWPGFDQAAQGNSPRGGKATRQKNPVTTETSRGAPTPNLSLEKAPETRSAIVCDMLVLWVSVTVNAREAIDCFSTRCLREKKKQIVKVKMGIASCCPIPATHQYRLKSSSEYKQKLHRAIREKSPSCTPHGQQYAIICSKSY